jgi:rhodanese-related sulfurtransferase
MPTKKSVAKSRKKGKRKADQVALPVWAWIILGVAVLVTGYLLFIRFRPVEQPPLVRQPLPAEVDVDTAYIMYTHDAILLDIRPAGAYQMGFVPNSINIPLNELPDRLDEVPTVGDIIVVDEAGIEAGRGRDILIAAGFQRVTALQGGLEIWILERHYPFEGIFPR